METTNYATPPQTSLSQAYTPEFGYAGIWHRYFANCLDSFIISLLSVGLLFVIKDDSNLTSVIGFLLGGAYILFFWVAKNGQTLGKKALGVRIVKENGDQLDLSTGIVRYLGYLLSSFFMLGYIWAIFDSKKQGWHDKIANTLVIKTDNKSRAGIIALIVIGQFLFFILIFIVVFIGILAATKLGDKPLNIQLPQPTSVVNQISTDQLASDVFKAVNQKRAANSLQPLIEHSQLCAYATRRLSQIEKNDGYDDGAGFYDDLSNPNLALSYFQGFGMVGEHYYTNDSLTTEAVLNEWQKETDKVNIFNDKTKVYGCARVKDQDFVFLSASKAN